MSQRLPEELEDPRLPIHKQRKLLKDVQVGKVLMPILETIIIPFIKDKSIYIREAVKKIKC